jgi:S-methylmethionine-dependent homocysteine/selenocysteine methylase
MGWTSTPEVAATSYAGLARQWIDSGATLIGGCCGTAPAHIAALRKLISGVGSGK